ncbi:MAG: M48 family metalloprotease [Verrucomicrobiota bacterium]
MSRHRTPQRGMGGYGRRPRSAFKMRLIIALVMGGFALISYFKSARYNEVTGEKQYISLTPNQEIALGLQAAPEMVHQHGGLYLDRKAQALVDRVGQTLVNKSAAGDTQWQFDFHLLADPETVNAFALPGGQIFITAALYQRLKSEGQLAGVLGHEIGHVVARHGAQRIAKGDLTKGLIGAVVTASGDYNTSRVAGMVGNLINMKYGRDDELESDELGVRFLGKAGYDPRALIGVMKILAEANRGQKPPEFMSTHPSSGNRVDTIKAAIQKHYPNGLPQGLIQ